MAAQFGRRLRRGVATTAVAAAAVAALSASQAPNMTDGSQGQTSGAGTPDGSSATGDSPYYTDLPPLGGQTPQPPVARPPAAAGGQDSGIPATVLDAYKKAADSLATAQPGCNLRWELLAAIGKVESGHAEGGRVDAAGNTLSPILGPVLDGIGFAKITDTDDGQYDGDIANDRAVGPMQFIPSTWSQGGPEHTGWGADGNGDGKTDPNNVYDAALAAGRYLCAGGRDMADTAGLHQAILAYNHSDNYLHTVLSWYDFYRKGSHEIPDGTGTPPRHRSDDPVGASPSPGPSVPGSSKPGGGKHPGGTPGGGSGGTSSGGGSGGTTSGGGTGGTTAGGDSGGGTGGTGGDPAGGTTTGGGTGGTIAGGDSGGGTGGTGGDSGGGSGGTTTGGDSGGGTGGTTAGGDSGGDTGGTTPGGDDGDQADAVTHFEDAGTGTLTATAGETFAEPVKVRAADGDNNPVSRVRVQFALVGDTDATFDGGGSSATVQTDSSGVATAPALKAGEKTGDFTVRATVVGSAVSAVDFKATVTARQADTIARTSDAALTSTPGGTFGDDVQVKATLKGAVAAGVAVVATLIKSKDDPSEISKGPFFKNADGKQVRTRRGLKTDADGLLKLPNLFAGNTTGSFLLRLTSPGGGLLDMTLKVEKAAEQLPHAPSPAPSGSV